MAITLGQTQFKPKCRSCGCEITSYDWLSYSRISLIHNGTNLWEIEIDHSLLAVGPHDIIQQYLRVMEDKCEALQRNIHYWGLDWVEREKSSTDNEEILALQLKLAKEILAEDDSA